MSDILIGVIVFGLVFGAAIFGMFPGRNLRVLEQNVNASEGALSRHRAIKRLSPKILVPSRFLWQNCLKRLELVGSVNFTDDAY